MSEEKEWFMSPHLSSLEAMNEEALSRLLQAIHACGYANEGDASKMLGEEYVAILRRLTHGWKLICSIEEPERLQCISDNLAAHLYAVKTGEAAPLAVKDRDREAARRQATRDHVMGEKLFLTLARVLDNDAALIPVFEARHVRVDGDVAVLIAQELHRQWKGTPMPKATFRRALTRRLKAAAR